MGGCKSLISKLFFLTLKLFKAQYSRLGVFGHLAVIHVVLVTKHDPKPVVHTATLSIKVIYQKNLLPVMRVNVSC